MNKIKMYCMYTCIYVCLCECMFAYYHDMHTDIVCRTNFLLNLLYIIYTSDTRLLPWISIEEFDPGRGDQESLLCLIKVGTFSYSCSFSVYLWGAWVGFLR